MVVLGEGETGCSHLVCRSLSFSLLTPGTEASPGCSHMQLWVCYIAKGVIILICLKQQTQLKLIPASCQNHLGILHLICCNGKMYHRGYGQASFLLTCSYNTANLAAQRLYRTKDPCMLHIH